MMKYGTDFDLEAMANELLESARPRRAEPAAAAAPKKKREAAPQQPARPSLAALQPRPVVRRYTIGFSANDANALVQLIDWVNQYADETNNATLDVNISWCPGTSSWLVWCTRYDAERPTLAGAVKSLLRQMETGGHES